MACEICHTPFVLTTDDLDSDAKPHVCTTCGRSFSLKIQLKRHILTHSGGAPYICNSCEKNITNSEVMSSSVKKPEKKCHVCDVCNQKFPLKRLLKKHYLIHTTSDDYVCGVCNYICPSELLLKKHSLLHKTKKEKIDKRKNGSSADKLYVCSTCCKAFVRKKAFEKHVAAHEFDVNSDSDKTIPDENIMLTDQTHGKRKKRKRKEVDYSEGNYLDTKEIKIEGEIKKKHSCDICGSSFSRKSALDGHILIHVEDAIRDDTDKESDREENNTVAEKVVRKELALPKIPKLISFQCDSCDNSFTSKAKLNKHRASHKKEIFGVSNKIDHNESSESMKVEKLILIRETKQKKEKKFACKVCKKTFVGENCFKKHVFRKHEQTGNSMEQSSSQNEEASNTNEQTSVNDELKSENEAPIKRSRGKKRGIPKKEISFICEFCNEDFTGRRALFTRHRISHTPEVCGICDQRFINREALREHCKSHIGTEEARRFLECSQKAFNSKKGITTPEPKVEYIYLVIR